jgi:6-pyruvoyltetrahydropterin/6-carboxytetrahydropterin synthase
MSSDKLEVNARANQADKSTDNRTYRHDDRHANDQEVLVRHVASTRFEAAREIGGLSADNKFARVHGHGFLVSVHADGNLLGSKSSASTAALAAAWPPYRGGEVPAMLGELQLLAQKLDYQHLNDVVPNPSDVQVAKWFDRQLSVPHLSAIALQSTPEQGVLVGVGADSDAGADGQPAARLLVWRRYRFHAAHQLPNVAPGHKCGRMHGHGFEVVLYAQSGDGLDDNAVNYSTLDAAWAQVVGQLSFQCLNDIPGLENPTSELLSSWIWQRLKSVVPTLSAVTVYETASCGATFDGERYRIWKDFSIDSAVRYRHAADVQDPRARLHGYTYTLRLSLCAPLDDVMGWTVDFGDVKEVFHPVFKALDHHPLHENPEISAVSDGDTASMARWLFHKTQRMLPSMVRVDLFETEGCGASVGTDLEGPPLPLVRL